MVDAAITGYDPVNGGKVLAGQSEMHTKMACCISVPKINMFGSAQKYMDSFVRHWYYLIFWPNL